MLSGVMLKTGVYGLMRYFLWLVPVRAQADYPLARWGMLVAVLGTITLFTGTMQALKQEQSKRLLAFHSIGQIGYILLGTGTCMALLPVNTPATAALATIGFFGALFHVLNHGLFKGLLFLNAGSMLHATGTQDLNQMGGMMKFMPLTAITALIASFSISGVPLFNGYVSKWSIAVAAIQGSGSAHYLVVCAVIAILTSALTLASFMKFFGVSFLSRTSALVRERAAQSGRLEVPWMMQLCLLYTSQDRNHLRPALHARGGTADLRVFWRQSPAGSGSGGEGDGMKARILYRNDVLKIVDLLRQQGYEVIAPFRERGRDTFFDPVTDQNRDRIQIHLPNPYYPPKRYVCLLYT